MVVTDQVDVTVRIDRYWRALGIGGLAAGVATSAGTEHLEVHVDRSVRPFRDSPAPATMRRNGHPP